MATVEQEIELMSPATFESFVHQVLVARYPSADIKQVDGSGGDQGVDSFEGTLSDGPAVWQCKHLSNRLGQDQKEQIVESIQTAFRHRTPASWTLCVPINLRTTEHAWFQEKIVARFSTSSKISLIQNSDFLKDIARNRDLTYLFFAETGVSNLFRLEEKILGIPNTLAARELLQRQVEHYLRKLGSLDTRLSSMMIHHPDQSPLRTASAESLFVVHDRFSSLHFVARDPELLRKNPIVLTCTFRSDVQAEVENALDTGDGFRLPVGSILSLTASSPLIQSFLPMDTSFLELEAVPAQTDQFGQSHFRLVSGQGRSAREIPFLRCRITKSGRKEFTQEGEIPGLKITIKVNRATRKLYINFGSNFGDVDVRLVNEALNFLYTLENTGKLHIYNLETQKLVYKQNLSNMASVDACFGITKMFKRILANALTVAEHFDVTIRLPTYLHEKDAQNLEMITAMVWQGYAENVQLSTTLKKSASHVETMKAVLKGESVELSLYQKEGEDLEIFGVKLRTRPVTFKSSSAKCSEYESLIREYEEAAEGEKIQLLLQCASCSFVFEEREGESELVVAYEGDLYSLPLLR